MDAQIYRLTEVSTAEKPPNHSWETPQPLTGPWDRARHHEPAYGQGKGSGFGQKSRVQSSEGEQPLLKLCVSFPGLSVEPSSVWGLGQCPGCCLARALHLPSHILTHFSAQHWHTALTSVCMIIRDRTNLCTALFPGTELIPLFPGV